MDTIGPEKKDRKAVIKNYSTFTHRKSLFSHCPAHARPFISSGERIRAQFMSVIALQKDQDQGLSQEKYCTPATGKENTALF